MGGVFSAPRAAPTPVAAAPVTTAAVVTPMAEAPSETTRRKRAAEDRNKISSTGDTMGPSTTLLGGTQ
jgi:hypothetical protein|tara:strand:+ start:551 stop:754 length:204 start_codon:yes stop_codon:yes gene_type:complete